MPLSQLKQTGQSLGKTGTVKLTEIFQTGSGQTLIDRGDGGASASFFGYNRVYTDGADDYKQINPFQVDSNDAPNPAVWNKSDVGSGSRDTGYMLSLWDGYDHWSGTAAAEAKSTNFNCTNITDTTATFTWNRAAGYDRNNVELFQKLYVNECDSDAFNACDDCGDAQASSSSTTDVFVHGDTPTDTATALTEGTCYVATVTTLWDDRGTNSNYRESVTADSVEQGDLTEGIGITTTDQIYFRTAYNNCQQIATPGLAAAGSGQDACGGASVGNLFSPDGASSIATLSINDNIFTNDTCTSGLVSHTFVSDSIHHVQTDGAGTVTDNPAVCLI